MSRPLPKLFARPLIRLWLSTGPGSWRNGVRPADTPHVHAAGLNPDRVLLTGDGAVTGHGVVTHDLGLPGHLARSLSTATGHATDVDVVVDQTMTVRNLPNALTDTNLSRFDVILLAVGHHEALTLMSSTVWETELTKLMHYLETHTPAATKIFLLTIPVFGTRTRFPAPLARTVDQHVGHLNNISATLVSTRQNISLIPVSKTNEFEPGNRHVYRQWADAIAARIRDELDPDRLPAVTTAVEDEETRLAALETLGDLDNGQDHILNSLAESARRAFGTSIGAITFIRSDTQVMAAVTGIDPLVLPRDQSFCNVTIRQAGHLIIEDAAADSRYSHYSVVEGSHNIRFYAGYPIESPDGHRIGALCVLDTEPRHFTVRDIELLRTFAKFAEGHLWRRLNP